MIPVRTAGIFRLAARGGLAPPSAERPQERTASVEASPAPIPKGRRPVMFRPGRTSIGALDALAMLVRAVGLALGAASCESFFSQFFFGEETLLAGQPMLRAVAPALFLLTGTTNLVFPRPLAETSQQFPAGSLSGGEQQMRRERTRAVSHPIPRPIGCSHEPSSGLAIESWRRRPVDAV